MNIQVRERPEAASSVTAKTAIADCDIHPARATRPELYPFLAKRWHEHLETYEKHPYQGMMEGPPYPKAQPNASRRDAYPPEGGPHHEHRVDHQAGRRAGDDEDRQHAVGRPQEDDDPGHEHDDAHNGHRWSGAGIRRPRRG